MNHKYKTADLNLPHLDITDKLHRIIDARLRENKTNLNNQNHIYWNATYFGLNQVNIFNESQIMNLKLNLKTPH